MGVICVRDVRVLALLSLEAQYHRAGRLGQARAVAAVGDDERAGDYPAGWIGPRLRARSLVIRRAVKKQMATNMAPKATFRGVL